MLDRTAHTTARPLTKRSETSYSNNESVPQVRLGYSEFGRIDPDTGRFEPVCFLPGFARGLSFVGDYAVIGLSRPRENRTFEGLKLNERLEAEGVAAQCAICVVNLRTGDIEHRLEIGGIVEEIYDVNLLPNVIRPMALGFRKDEIRFTIRPEALSEQTGTMN